MLTIIVSTTGGASLASDLMEEFRSPVAGRLTLNLVNNQVFGKEDFYSNPKERMYLRREALKRYFVEYEEMLNREFVLQETGENTTFRKCFRYQAEKLAAEYSK
ncbi:MAG: CRISPR-associated endonuclease Cas1 [Candidatus Brocadia sp.]|nr:CRISPR-associated endonuclease Cas1 [Candidatus Brocadia sp.]